VLAERRPAASRAPRPGRVLATVTAAQVLSVASATVVGVALPSLGADLHAAGTELQWVVDAFVLVFASLLVAGGVVGDRRGRRTAFLAGLVLFAAGSLWCALAPSVGWLLAGRVVQALGPPLVLPASLAIVTTTYTSPMARARAIGLWGAGSGLGLALGPVLGGLIVTGLGWRWVFGANVPICLVLIALAVRGIPRDRPPPPEHRFDGAAALLLTGSVALLTFGVIEGRELGWRSGTVLGVFAAAVLLGAAFARREAHHPAPLVDLALLRHRAFLAANLGAATLYGCLTGLAVYFSVFFQQVQGRSALEAGLCLLPQGVFVAVSAPLAGRLTARHGPRPPVLAGMAITAAAVLCLLRLEPDTSFAQMWWAFALLGLGTGLALPPMTVTAISSVRDRDAGMASAIHNASRQLGQTFGVAVLGTIILGRAGDGAQSGALTGTLAAAWVSGLHAALVVAAATLVLAAVAITALVPRTVPSRADR
jgi:DHA2 family methylenomycin A resistance protein-like MFS transporter